MSKSKKSDWQYKFSAGAKGQSVPKQDDSNKPNATQRHKARMAKLSQAEKDARARKIAKEKRNNKK